MRERIASILTAAVLAMILYWIFSRIIIVVWVQMPWWVLVGLVLVIFLAFDHYLSKAFAKRKP